MGWGEIKDVVEAALRLSEDALHIYAALLVQLAAAFIFRKSVAHPLPWIAVLLLELVNEWADMHNDDLIERWEIEGAFHDLVNTMLLPTLLLLVARYAPQLLTAHSHRQVRAESDFSRS